MWFNKPKIGLAEKIEVWRTLSSGWIGTGKKTKLFERMFEEYQGIQGIKYALAVSSCTSALHLSLLLENVKEGDEVIVPAITFPATANVVEHTGAKPVFVDVESSTLNIDPELIEEKITDKTKAIMVVHMCGHPVELDKTNEIADRHNIPIIQDSAHAIESEYINKKCAHYSKYSAYSFYATKNLTTAEGGMLIVDDKEDYEKAEILSLHGISKDAWKRYQASTYQHWDSIYPGYKYNMTDVQASLGIHQLKRIEKNWRFRHKVVNQYISAFKNIETLELFKIKSHVRHAHYLFSVCFDTDSIGLSRDKIIRKLEEKGVGIGVHFRALPLLTFYREKYGYKPGDFPIASYYGNRIISLPLHLNLTQKEVKKVINTVIEVTVK